jgi:hypothetical protein
MTSICSSSIFSFTLSLVSKIFSIALVSKTFPIAFVSKIFSTASGGVQTNDGDGSRFLFFAIVFVVPVD